MFTGKTTGRWLISVSPNNPCSSGQKKKATIVSCGYIRGLFWGLSQISWAAFHFKFCSWTLYIFIRNTKPAWLSNRENSAPNSIHNSTCARVTTVDQMISQIRSHRQALVKTLSNLNFKKLGFDDKKEFWSISCTYLQFLIWWPIIGHSWMKQSHSS